MLIETSTRPDPVALAMKARSLLDQGHPGAARPLISALRSAGAETELAAELEARCCFAQGRIEEAMAVLAAALDATGTSVALYIARAELRLLVGERVGAAADAAEAIIYDPGNAVAKALLGRALLQLNFATDAATCLQEALAALPLVRTTRLDLADALERLGRPEASEAVLADGVALDPADASLRSAALLRRIKARDFSAAVTMGHDARQHAALDACGYGLVGHALSSLGRHDEAADAYVEALKLAPEDPYMRHLVASAGRCAAGESAPPEYVRILFDSYADHFDHHLIQLGYRVPGLVRRTLARYPRLSGPVLDLGCGTGLLALACGNKNDNEIENEWIGVDLSTKMLDLARAKALYAELHEIDALTYLVQETRVFPLILAGDVLCYFGRLNAVLHAVKPRLQIHGKFVFTVESFPSSEGAVRLGRRGRYAHSADHLGAVARDAGLIVSSLEEHVLRFDGSEPVPGLVAVVEHVP